jgi:glucose-6-phosphate 1-dehydrogenase
VTADHGADAVVLFGATGDLALKKLFPALYRLHRQGALPGPVVGVGRRELGDEGLRQRAATSVRDALGRVDDADLTIFASRLSYVRGDYNDPALFEGVGAALGAARAPLAFLAIPPDAFETVVAGLAAVGLNQHGRVVVEKPFGRDLGSARQLNATLLAHFPESAIFRIDHFLGKEPVQNILITRFANGIFEPIWNRHHIDRVQLTMAEAFGIEGRGEFYDHVGTLRDVVQNHLLQLVCFLAMEPPVSDDAGSLRDEVVKVLKSIRSVAPSEVVRGQYQGYRDEDGVAPDSDTETFVAVQLAIDSWRWSGVPFYIQAGKCLAATTTSAVVEFKAPPRPLFADADLAPHPNHLRFEVKPRDLVSLHLQSKLPGDRMVGRGVELDVSAEEAFGEGPEAYERLIGDALEGDARLFGRQDAVEESWRIVDEVLNAAPPVLAYEPGSWGPAAAARLIGHGG